MHKLAQEPLQGVVVLVTITHRSIIILDGMYVQRSSAFSHEQIASNYFVFSDRRRVHVLG